MAPRPTDSRRPARRCGGEPDAAGGVRRTKAEVIEARDNTTCIAIPKSAYEAMVEARGYDDIDADLAWEKWLGIRDSLHSDEA